MRLLPIALFGLILGSGPLASAQYVVARPQAVAPRPTAVTRPRGGFFLSGPDLRRPQPSANIPYTRSPYTDDWSTGRNLPFPKPWMNPHR